MAMTVASPTVADGTRSSTRLSRPSPIVCSEPPAKHQPLSPSRMDAAAAAWLGSVVGARPLRSWREEWPALRLQELKLTGQTGGLTTIKAVEKDDPLDQAIGRMKDRIDWKMRNGWSRDEAEAVTCISSSGLTAIGHAMRAGAHDYDASTHILSRVLVAHASADAEPLVYRNLTGTFGLATIDPCWVALLRAGGGDASAIGSSFVTSTTIIASDSCVSFPPDGRGFCVPLKVDGKLTHVLQDSDVVAFRSAPADERGLHSFAHTSASMYQAPPRATVVVEKVEESGRWTAYGTQVHRRCFTVSITYGGQPPVSAAA